MGRRGRGEGSIYQRKNGTWCGQYRIETPQGVKKKYIYAKTRRQVASKLAKAIAERDSGSVYDSGSLTVSDYLDRWLTSTKGTISLNSWKQYEIVSRLHVKPSVGGTKLVKLNSLQLQDLYGQKLEAGLSPRRVRYIHVTIHKALRDAVKWRLIPYNVAEACTPPKLTKREIQPFDAEQVRLLLNTAEQVQPRLYALYALAVTTGMRQGELLGLKPEDVSIENKRLSVRRAIFNGVVSPTKSANGKRSIKLSKIALDALEHHLRRYAGHTWVFCTRNQTPISPWNFYHKSWRPLLRAAGLPRRRFHDLRHTAATLMLQKNVNPKIVSNVLGHADVAFTLTTYSHVLPWMQNPAAEAMDDIFGG